MTPELKTACELIFHEHKVSTQPIKWTRDVFRGRISIGLSEMARETLVKKNIIVLPDKSKKIFTQLNPEVANANSFEEAEQLIENKARDTTTVKDHDAEAHITNHVIAFATPPVVKNSFGNEVITAASVLGEAKTKWWLKPVYLYALWPLCGALAGVLISFLLNFLYTLVFVHAK